MEKNQRAWKDFLELCLSSDDEKILALLFDLFLTSEERADLATRYLIVKELLRGEKTQRDIAKSLSVSIAKITRGSNELKRINKSLLKYLKAHLKLQPY